VVALIDQTLLQQVAEKLKKQGVHIATAESCTGGLLAHTLTNVSGSSEYFDRGIVTYSNQAKIELLGISEAMLRDYGAVSEQTAKAMALGAKNQSQVDIGISTTGIAGPTGGSKEKPVGLVYIGIATPEAVTVQKFLFKGNRLQNKEQTCNAALKMLLEHI